MKLNNQQIQSLAHNINLELREETAKHNQEARAKAYKEFYKTKLGKMYVELNEQGLLSPMTLKPLDLEGQQQVLDKYLKLDLKNPIAGYSSNVFNDIVVATIECENIDELINKVKNKYK